MVNGRENTGCSKTGQLDGLNLDWNLGDKEPLVQADLGKDGGHKEAKTCVIFELGLLKADQVSQALAPKGRQPEQLRQAAFHVLAQVLKTRRPRRNGFGKEKTNGPGLLSEQFLRVHEQRCLFKQLISCLLDVMFFSINEVWDSIRRMILHII